MTGSLKGQGHVSRRNRLTSLSPLESSKSSRRHADLNASLAGFFDFMSSIPSAPATPLLHPRRERKLFSVCPFILGNEFCERLAYYGIAVNLPIYLTSVMNLSVADASVQTSLFSGTCYITPLLGAWLADGHWGRYKTIVVFSSIYCLGMTLLAATRLVPGLGPHKDASVQPVHFAVLYLALYIVTLGTGGIKPNVNAFGADQFDETDPEENEEKRSFFNWFYFSINLGGIIAMTVIVWIQSWSWGIGFGIPALAMALAVVVFLSGHHKYKRKQPTGSPIATAAILCWCAAREWVASVSVTAYLRAVQDEIQENAEGEEDELTLPLSTTSTGADDETDSQHRDCLDRAGEKQGYTTRDVAEVRCLLRLTPFFFLMVSYCTAYSHMFSVFVLQGHQMDRRVSIGSSEFVVPAASMPLFDTVTILLLIPVYSNFLQPLLKRFNRELSVLARTAWGFAICAAAMLVAGAVERWRSHSLGDGLKLSVLAQIPQYTLVGASEVFAMVGQMEYFYDEAPESMRSVSAALGLLSIAGGSYISAGLLTLVSSTTSWLDNINDPRTNRLDVYLYLLGIFMVVNTLVFVWFANRRMKT